MVSVVTTVARVAARLLQGRPLDRGTLLLFFPALHDLCNFTPTRTCSCQGQGEMSVAVIIVVRAIFCCVELVL